METPWSYRVRGGSCESDATRGERPISRSHDWSPHDWWGCIEKRQPCGCPGANHNMVQDVLFYLSGPPEHPGSSHDVADDHSFEWSKFRHERLATGRFWSLNVGVQHCHLTTPNHFPPHLKAMCFCFKEVPPPGTTSCCALSGPRRVPWLRRPRWRRWSSFVRHPGEKVW